MFSVSKPARAVAAALLLSVLPVATLPGVAQRYRKSKKLEPAARIVVTVEKAFNGKPISNAAVVFRAYKDGKSQGSMEVKTSPEGEATIDIIEVGSHVQVQVIADGFSTAAQEFDVPTEQKALTIRMEKPRAQVSAYENNDGKASQRVVGVQEPRYVPSPKKKAGASGASAGAATQSTVNGTTTVQTPVSSPDPKAKSHPDNAPTSSPQ